MKIYLHINYFEKGESLADAFAIARKIGADGLELRRRPVGSHQAAQSDYLDQIARAWDCNPVAELSFGAPGPNLAMADHASRAKELESACAFYEEAARRFPVKIINLFLGELLNPDTSIPPTRFSKQGSSLASPGQWEWACEGGRHLAELGARHGFRLALETHGIYLHDSVDAACRLVERVGRPDYFGVLWDHANEYLFDETPTMEDSFQRCQGSLFYVHLKNLITYAGGGYRICALEEGLINTRHQLKLLKEGGFSGPVAIECPRAGDRIRFLHQDFAYAKDLIQNLGRE